MRIKLKGINETKFNNRYCYFGITNASEFADLFGMNTTFIGSLTKIENRENEYNFTIDKIEREHIQTLVPLDANKKADRRYMLLALIHDYGFSESEFETID